MKRVLVVEDFEALRQALVVILEDQGFEVVDAENGQVGLERIAQQEEDGKIDLILTDLSMPFMNGPAMIKELRRQKVAIPIILMSMDFSEESANKKAKVLGADAGVAKPFQIYNLVDLIGLMTK